MDIESSKKKQEIWKTQTVNWLRRQMEDRENEIVNNRRPILEDIESSKGKVKNVEL